MSISTVAPCREPVPNKNGPLREALKRGGKPNMGYRMVHELVKSKSAPPNIKWTHQMWKEAQLGRLSRCRKKLTGNPIALKAERPNHVWCVDFIHDACLNGSKLKILSDVDEFTPDCLSHEVDTGLNARRVPEVLAPLMESHGARSFFAAPMAPDSLRGCWRCSFRNLV